MFPEAPIYTSQFSSNPKVWYGDNWFEDADIRAGWLQKLPSGLKKFLPPLRALYFSRLNLSGYDLVISSSGAEAKGVKTGPKTLHISYVLSPTHYYWVRYDEYLKNPGFGRLDPLARLGLKLLVGPLRRWDFKAAQRPNHIVAISEYDRTMIKKHYGRDSIIIHPPVDVERFKGNQGEHRNGFVITGRQVPYKRIDLAVRACSQLNLPLIVIGRGPEHKNLEKMAGRSITFLTKVTDDQMPEQLAKAEAFIFPGIDDFGIVAVEALAAGTPVIAYKGGGALDFVNETTGIFFSEQTPESLVKAVKEFSKLSFSHSQIAEQSQKFSPLEFRKNISDLVKRTTSPRPSI